MDAVRCLNNNYHRINGLGAESLYAGLIIESVLADAVLNALDADNVGADAYIGNVELPEQESGRAVLDIDLDIARCAGLSAAADLAVAVLIKVAGYFLFNGISAVGADKLVGAVTVVHRSELIVVVRLAYDLAERCLCERGNCSAVGIQVAIVPVEIMSRGDLSSAEEDVPEEEAAANRLCLRLDEAAVFVAPYITDVAGDNIVVKIIELVADAGLLDPDIDAAVCKLKSIDLTGNGISRSNSVRADAVIAGHGVSAVLILLALV